jgi:hypothetical protein
LVIRNLHIKTFVYLCDSRECPSPSHDAIVRIAVAAGEIVAVVMVGVIVIFKKRVAIKQLL